MRRRADLWIRQSVDAPVEEIVHETCRKTEGHEGGDPGGGTQSCHDGAKYPVPVVYTLLTGPFDFEKGQQEDRGNHEEEQDSPGPCIQHVEDPAHSATHGNGLPTRCLGSQTRSEELVL